MPTPDDSLRRVQRTLDAAWAELRESYAGLPDDRLIEPGVIENWSVKDILAHVTTWEEETLKYLPVIAAGGRPPKYITVGGIDAFNERTSAAKRELSLNEVLRQLDETHRRLLEYVEQAKPQLLAGETRFRRRLRVDTYAHYREHAKAIAEWRRRTGSG